MTRRIFRLSPSGRARALEAIAQAPDDWIVEVRKPTRSLQQNSLLWSRLDQLSEAVQWDGETLTPSEWKDLLTACLRKQKVVRGIEGGLVFLGLRTSEMTTAELNDLMALMDAFAAERGVIFTDWQHSEE